MSRRTELVEKLQDADFRAAFVSAQVRRLVAAQIKELRGDLTQAELAELAGLKQNAISRLEDPDYGKYTVSTLLGLARTFDVGLIVRFGSFAELVDWNVQANRSIFLPPSFHKDQRLHSWTKNVADQSFYRAHLTIEKQSFGEEFPGYSQGGNEKSLTLSTSGILTYGNQKTGFSNSPSIQ